MKHANRDEVRKLVENNEPGEPRDSVFSVIGPDGFTVWVKGTIGEIEEWALSNLLMVTKCAKCDKQGTLHANGNVVIAEKLVCNGCFEEHHDDDGQYMMVVIHHDEVLLFRKDRTDPRNTHDVNEEHDQLGKDHTCFVRSKSNYHVEVSKEWHEGPKAAEKGEMEHGFDGGGG